MLEPALLNLAPHYLAEGGVTRCRPLRILLNTLARAAKGRDMSHNAAKGRFVTIQLVAAAFQEALSRSGGRQQQRKLLVRDNYWLRSTFLSYINGGT